MSDKFADIIGLLVADAENLLKDRGINRIRVRTKDGQSMIGTCDYRTDRLNVAVQDGIIVAISGVG